MKIGMLSQWFDPETGPAALPGIYAREFVRQGHKVSVLTGFPNYPEGRLYPGYKMSATTVEGAAPLRITRVPLYPNHSRSVVGRAANYASFAASAALFGGSSLKGADAIWVYNSPITVAAPMLVHSRFGKVPVFLHVQDLWPDSLLDSGMMPQRSLSGALYGALAALVRLMETTSAVVGVISPSVRELILERHPQLDGDKIIYAPNPTNESLFRPSSVLREEFGIDRDAEAFNLMYAGAIGDLQGLDTVLGAMEILRDRPEIKITLVGDGISRRRLEEDTEKRGLTSVRFVGRVPQDEIPRLIAQSDAQLISLASSPFLEYTTPSKIPSLLASETPLIAQIGGDGARLLRQSGAALVTKPGDAEELAEAIRRLADQDTRVWDTMGRAGRDYYEAHFSVRQAAKTITNALEHAHGSISGDG